jgi:hypothetical protein
MVHMLVVALWLVVPVAILVLRFVPIPFAIGRRLFVVLFFVVLFFWRRATFTGAAFAVGCTTFTWRRATFTGAAFAVGCTTFT